MKTHLLNQYKVENVILARVLKNIFTFGFILISFCGWSQTLTALSVSSASGTRTYGTAGTITYTVTATRRNNGNGSAAFSISALPSGVTAGFSPVTFSFSGNNRTAITTLTLTTTALAKAVTNSSFTVTATATNSFNNTGSFTINKATPTVRVSPTATSITYSQTLASSILSGGTSSVLGSYAFTTPSTAPNAGTISQGVTFTPTDISNYNTTTTTASVTIIKATPTVTLVVSNSPSTYSGSVQSASIAISTSSIPGNVSAILTGGAATQTAAGTYAVTASFVPTDSVNYNTLTGLSAGNFVIIPAALSMTANNASKCFGETYDLGTSAFTSLGLISPETIGSVTLTSSGLSSGSYSIVPSAATGGTFLAKNYSITYNDGVLTVNPNNTAGVASSTPTLSINTVLTDITHSTTGATGIGTAINLPLGVTASWASDTITIIGTPTLSGTFTYSIPLTGGCGNVNATGIITVVDTIAPVANVLSLSPVTGECSATITTVPTATDNCNGTIVGTTTDLLTRDIQGTSTVTWIFTDAVGNTSTQTQDIVVIDTIAPVADALSLPPVIGLCSATIVLPPTATDNCSGIIVGTTTDLLTREINGTSTVNWIFTDAVGNKSIQTQDLIVTDIPDTVASLTISDIYLCKYIGTTNPVTFKAASGASSYIWTVPADVTIISGQGTDSLVVDFHSATAIGNTIMGFVGVKAVNASGCVSTIPKAYGLVPRYPKAPSTLALTYNGVTKYRVGNFIGEASKTLVLTATDNSGSATSYYWDLPAGVNLVSGNPNNDKVISINFGNVIPGTTDLVFNVYSLAGCGSSIAQTQTIKRDLPSVPTVLTLTDDAISKLIKITNVTAYTGKLKTTTLTLTATPATVPGYESTSYKWVLPSSIAIVAASANFVSEASGFKTYTSTSNVISINLSGIGTATSLLLKVYGVNGNGESLLSRNLTLKSTIPVKPGALKTLSGAVATYHPTCNSITVKVPNVLGVSYLWSITGGALATIVAYNSDGNEATIDVSQLSSTPLSTFTLNVRAYNGTGTSIASIYVINLGSSCISRSKKMSQKIITLEKVSDEFNAIAYPNPSSSVFNIKIQSSDKGETEVKVLDITGRIIERFKVQSNSVELGSRYPSGIYKVIINQGEKYKILQIIKD